MTYSEFKMVFERKVKSDKRENIFTGTFLSLIGITLFVLDVVGILKSDNSAIPTFVITLIALPLGIVNIYWSFYGLRIRHYAKKVTNTQLEQNIISLNQKNNNFGIIEQRENYYALFVKPKGLTSWKEIHMLFDDKSIYINTRAISTTLYDFGKSKELEEEIVNLLNTSNT